MSCPLSLASDTERQELPDRKWHRTSSYAISNSCWQLKQPEAIIFLNGHQVRVCVHPEVCVCLFVFRGEKVQAFCILFHAQNFVKQKGGMFLFQLGTATGTLSSLERNKWVFSTQTADFCTTTSCFSLNASPTLSPEISPCVSSRIPGETNQLGPFFFSLVRPFVSQKQDTEREKFFEQFTNFQTCMHVFF